MTQSTTRLLSTCALLCALLFFAASASATSIRGEPEAEKPDYAPTPEPEVEWNEQGRRTNRDFEEVDETTPDEREPADIEHYFFWKARVGVMANAADGQDAGLGAESLDWNSAVLQPSVGFRSGNRYYENFAAWMELDFGFDIGLKNVEHENHGRSNDTSGEAIGLHTTLQGGISASVFSLALGFEYRKLWGSPIAASHDQTHELGSFGYFIEASIATASIGEDHGFGLSFRYYPRVDHIFLNEVHGAQGFSARIKYVTKDGPSSDDASGWFIEVGAMESKGAFSSDEIWFKAGFELLDF